MELQQSLVNATNTTTSDDNSQSQLLKESSNGGIFNGISNSQQGINDGLDQGQQGINGANHSDRGVNYFVNCTEPVVVSNGAPPQPSFKRVCVFCGSNSGNKEVFSEAALQLGKELVRRKMELVYGGGSVGLMGLVSKTVFDGGCHVIGIIPKALTARKIMGEAIGEMKVVSDMHERKAEMARQADAFIALPGGYGTLEELLEVITWSQLGIHDKPVGLLNVDGYYNSLLDLFDKFVEEGFMKSGARQIVVSAPTPSELLTKMQEFVPVHDKVASRQSWEIESLNS